MVEASPRRVFANAHTYHINSISVNSDNETYLSADDLRINLWHLEITDRSFSILLSHPSLTLICPSLFIKGRKNVRIPLFKQKACWVTNLLEYVVVKIFRKPEDDLSLIKGAAAMVGAL